MSAPPTVDRSPVIQPRFQTSTPPASPRTMRKVVSNVASIMGVIKREIGTPYTLETKENLDRAFSALSKPDQELFSNIIKQVVNAVVNECPHSLEQIEPDLKDCTQSRYLQKKVLDELCKK